MLSPGVVEVPSAAATGSSLRCKILTANQSSTNTAGTGDATLLAFPVVAGKEYFVRLRGTANGFRGAFTLPPASDADSSKLSYFGANDGFTGGFRVAGCVTNITTMTSRVITLNGNLWTTATAAIIAPIYGRGRLVVPYYSGTLTLCMGGTAATLYAGTSLQIEEL